MMKKAVLLALFAAVCTAPQGSPPHGMQPGPSIRVCSRSLTLSLSPSDSLALALALTP